MAAKNGLKWITAALSLTSSAYLTDRRMYKPDIAMSGMSVHPVALAHPFFHRSTSTQPCEMRCNEIYIRIDALVSAKGVRR